MPNRTCSIDGCDKPVHVKEKGWCVKHYSRWYRHGDPRRERERPGFFDRFDSYVAKDGECWLWTGGIGGSGYGVFSWRRGSSVRSVSAHRLAYSTLYGTIPPGLHLDHLCCVKACVNPAHLEAVTPAENTRRWRQTLARTGPT